ncbi:MAG: hypothetical protein HRU30_00115 [Rhodobacteraceae bacterium]|nr:hypothetical protein [Paracoccaceae bacterium]
MAEKNSFIYDAQSVGFSENGHDIAHPIIMRRWGLKPDTWAREAGELVDLLNAHIDRKPYATVTR